MAATQMQLSLRLAKYTIKLDSSQFKQDKLAEA